jgi:hypothetical protein
LNYLPEPSSLQFRHNIQPKLRSVNETREEGIDNIVNKFRLLGQDSVQIEETQKTRIITIPLILENEMSDMKAWMKPTKLNG